MSRTVHSVHSTGESDRKAFMQGTHRLCSPKETFERYWPIGKKLGITRIANITGLDTIGIPVCVSMRPNSRGLSTSQGKGLNIDCAKTSALMESIECWHGEHINLPVRHNSYAGLQQEGEAVIDIKGLSTYAESLIQPHTPLYWLQGEDLQHNTHIWVPFDAVSTNYVWPGRGGVQNNFVISTNGLASGNSLLEASCHALAEVIERDAIEHKKLAIRRGDADIKVALDTIDDPDCQSVLHKLTEAGVLVGVYNITSDLGVPAFACTIVDGEDQGRWRSLPAFSGYGCHPAPAIALMRALTEAVQSRLTHISGSRDDIFWSDYNKLGNKDDLAQYRNIIRAERGQCDFGSIRNISTHSFETDLDHMVSLLYARGARNIVRVDLTRPELEVPVVKVVVSGLAAPSEKAGTRQVRSVQRAVPPAAQPSTEHPSQPGSPQS